MRARRKLIKVSEVLAGLLEARMPLASSLEALARDLDPGRLKNTLLALARETASGQSFSQAITLHKDLFHPRFYDLISAGERGGKLAEMLRLWAEDETSRSLLKRRIFQAALYPLSLLLAVIFGLTLVSLIIIPWYREMFGEFEVPLPALTSQVFRLYRIYPIFFLALGILGGVIVVAYYLLRLHPKFVRVMERLKLYIPFVGGILHRAILARFSSILGLLLSAETQLPEAVTLAGQASGSALLKFSATTVRKHIEAGERLSTALLLEKLFPQGFVWAVDMGESRGRLPSALLTQGKKFREQAERTSQKVYWFISPLLIIPVAVVMGFTIIGLLLPLMHLVTYMSGG